MTTRKTDQEELPDLVSLFVPGVNFLKKRLGKDDK